MYSCANHAIKECLTRFGGEDTDYSADGTLPAGLQHINGVSNSAMDLDQNVEITAQVVAEELHVDLCSIFFYDELQRMLTLRVLPMVRARWAASTSRCAWARGIVAGWPTGNDQ